MPHVEILVMRHGQTVADLTRPKVFAAADDPLTETGLAQARGAADWLALASPPQRIISSPLVRANMTAKEIARRVNLDVVIDTGLAERKNGALAGMTELDARAKGLWPDRGYLPHETAPGGETLIELRTRAETFWSRFVSQISGGERVLIVSHEQMIAMLFRCFLGLPTETCVRLLTGDTGVHCWRIDDNGGRTISYSNSRVHLEVNRGATQRTP